MRTGVRIAVLVGAILPLMAALQGCSTKQTMAEKHSVRTTGAATRAQTAAMPGAAAAAEAPKAVHHEPANATEAMKQAADAGKHLVVLAYRTDDDKTKKMKAVFARAEKSLGSKAVLYQLNVGDEKEGAFVGDYQLAAAPLPLTLVFAPNRAVVNAYVQKVVDEEQLADSLASRKLAEVLKLLQAQKLVLVCVQGGSTKYNAESIKAARDVVADEKAGGAIQYVRVDPRDGGSADLLRQLAVDGSLKEATIAIVVPPGTVGGTVKGATTKEALWQAIVSSVSACGSGCGPGGCG